jgi:hypothetical protein
MRRYRKAGPESIEKNLSRLSYAELESRLSKESPAVWLNLLDSTSVKVGDTAADLLARHQALNEIVRRVDSGLVKTKLGKIRTQNILSRFGRQEPASKRIYLRFLSDRNPDVVDCALFGLVFLQASETIPQIEIRLSQEKPRNRLRNRLLDALRALREKNPKIYSPHYADAAGVWEL